MSVYTDVLQAVIDLMNSMNPYAPVIIGAMPPDDGISAAWASSAPRRTGSAKLAELEAEVLDRVMKRGDSERAPRLFSHG